MPGLGWRLQFDDKNLAHRMRNMVPSHVQRGDVVWPTPFPAYNQGETGTCAGHTGKELLLAEPCPQTDCDGWPTPFEIYRGAILRDPWDDNDHEAHGPDSGLQYGTSVLAVMQTLHEAGLISEYAWAYSVDEVADWLCTRGPVDAGTLWFEGFGFPDHERIIRDVGRNLGGHSYLLTGWLESRGLVPILNSHGPEYGDGGIAYLPAEVLDRLIRMGAEMATVVEWAT